MSNLKGFLPLLFWFEGNVSGHSTGDEFDLLRDLFNLWRWEGEDRVCSLNPVSGIELREYLSSLPTISAGGESDVNVGGESDVNVDSPMR